MQKAIRVLVLSWLSAACLEAGFVPISLGSVANTSLSTFPSLLNGNLFPTGAQTFSGVPFNIPLGGNNVWSADVAAGGAMNPSLQQTTVPIGSFGVSTIYTLMASEWGEPTGTVVTLVFTFSDGSTYSVGLTSNVAIRDYNNYTWTNTILSAWSAPSGMTDSTVNVWTDDGMGCNTPPAGVCSIANGNYQRLDEQIINIPAAFQNLTLVSMTIEDLGNHASPLDALNPNPSDAQRSFIAGLSLNAASPSTPEPGTFGLLLVGAGAIVALRKRHAN